MENGQRKKILYVITKSVWGGAQRYVFDLAINLPKDRFDVAVACDLPMQASQSPKNDAETLSGKLKGIITIFPILHFQKSINPMKEVFSFFEILAIFFHFKPDIVHVNSSKAGGIAGLAACVYRLISQKPIRHIFTVHGWAFLETWRPGWQRVLIRIISKTTVFLYNRIIVISNRDRDAAFTLTGLSAYNVARPSKVTLIHNGIGDLSFISRKEAQQKLLDAEYPLVIGAIAEWTKNKGLSYLIDAMPEIIRHVPDAKLCLVGWGEESSKFKVQSAKLKLEKNIFFASITPAASYLKAFDIFVLPSLKEGLPYTILEAGLAGLPVAATRVGGIPDIIEDGKHGILADPASPQQLANAIIKLSQDKDMREKMGKELHRRVMQNFSLSSMLQKTIEAYQL